MPETEETAFTALEVAARVGAVEKPATPDTRSVDRWLDAQGLDTWLRRDDSQGQTRDALDALAPNTRRNYGIAWRKFADFLGVDRPDPRAVTVDDLTAWARFMREVEGAASGSVSVRISAVVTMARIFGADVDSRAAALASAKKAAAQADKIAGRRPKQAKAIDRAGLAIMIAACADTEVGRRDAAMLALGWAGMMRRSEIANLDLGDVEISDGDDAVRLTVPPSKTNPRPVEMLVRGRGQVDLVAVLTAYREVRGSEDGPLFLATGANRGLRGGRLTGQAVDQMIRRRAKAAAGRAALEGIDLDGVSGHSLRRGRATDAARNGASVKALQAHGRWVRAETAVLYIEAAQDTDLDLGA